MIEKPEIESHPKQEIKPKTIWKELSYLEIGVIALAIGYFFYLNNLTSLVLNMNIENDTRIINGVSNPPNTVLYRANDFVPKSSVSNTHTFFGISIILILVILLLSKRFKILRRATIHEAINDISSQLIAVRQLKGASLHPIKNGLRIISDLEEIDLTYEFLTRYKTVGDKKWAFRYTIKVIITNKEEGVAEYYKAFYHPWSRYWDGLVETKKSLSDEDRCPKCGSDYDEKMIIAEDLLKYRRARAYIGEKGMRV